METDKTTPGYEEWNTLAIETVRQVKGLKLQTEIAEGILNHAECMAGKLKPKEKETPKTPDTATDDVKTHAKQTHECIGA